MRYEPVGYIVEYEVGALVIFFIIMLRYFSARRFPNQKNQLFTWIIWLSAAHIIWDILSSIIIDNVFMVPLAVTYLVNTSFYVSSVLLMMLMMVYVLALSDYVSRNRLKKSAPLFLPGIIVVFLLVINPITNWFFFVDPVRGYVHGKFFMYTYIVCLFYIVVSFIITFRSRAMLRKDEPSTIYKCLFTILALTILQYFIPALLVIGIAVEISVIMMYFTIQNPDTMFDATTGAFTYEAMLTFLKDRMRENEQTQIVAVKVQNMSRINELLGVENGSFLLKDLSDFLSASSNNSWVFRMRGSCFVVITRKSEDYRALCSKLDTRIDEPWLVGGAEVLLQASICLIDVAKFMTRPISPEEAVNYMETAIAQCERSGGRVSSVSVGVELMESVNRSQAVAVALKEAIESDVGLELYYQPLWSVEDRRFVSAEVLLRFNHPAMGFIPPDEFVPIAENNGLITALDELVVRKSCEFLSEYKRCENLQLDRIDINLSALEFMQQRLPETLSNIMSQYQIDPKLLCFEITETAATESFELLRECMGKICKYGCGFALDDFGTGYANISQVISLPFSLVKLDKSLLYGPEVVLQDMARMFARMERETVVEGVETEAQAQLVSSYQVDYIQGYYYAKPMCQADFLAFLKKESQI